MKNEKLGSQVRQLLSQADRSKLAEQATEINVLARTSRAATDQLFWKADWQESSDDELFQKVHQVTSRPR